MNKTITILLLAFCFTTFQSKAATKRSAEAVRVMNLATVIGGYATNHNGQIPASWDELNAWTESNGWPALKTFGSPPIQERYTLTSNAPVSQELNGAQVVAVGRMPFSDDGQQGEGRFVVYRVQNGQYQSEWYPEEKVQKLIAENHLTVPPQTVSQPAIAPTKWPDELYHLTPQQRADLKRSGLLPPEVEASYASSTNTKTPSSNSQIASSSVTQEGTTSLASSSSPIAPQTVPQIVSASDSSIPIWFYGIIVLSIAVIAGGGWYFLQQPKK